MELTAGKPAVSSVQSLLPDASCRQQLAADFIHCLFGAKRLTTSELSRQSRQQASLPPVLLLIRSPLCSYQGDKDEK